jgi:hypothetical protein
MALLDDLHHIISIQEREKKFKALRSAVWLFERNPDLPLDQQSAGIALLIAAYLPETDELMSSVYRQVISRIIRSRPYSVGAQIDWGALTSALPHLPTEKVWMVLYLLRYATDERYLSLLERNFDNVDSYAVSSWAILAYTQRYHYDPQVRPFLQEAQETILKRFDEAHRRVLYKLHKASIARKELLRADPWFRGANAWARQQFAEAEQRIRQHVQLRPQPAPQSVAEDNERRRIDPAYFPTQIQRWLATPTSKETFHNLIRLRNTFEFGGTSHSLPIDEVAHCVQVLMDYVLAAEDYMPPGERQSVHLVIWQIIGLAFYEHRYVGTYLDWEMLEERLVFLNEKGDDPTFRFQLRCILACFTNSNEEHALEVLKPYLDHPDGSVRETTLESLKDLIWHLAHYCAEALPAVIEAENTLKRLAKMAETPEKWQQIKACLEQEEHDARPYFHFYSI